jgi:hypothetical protein
MNEYLTWVKWFGGQTHFPEAGVKRVLLECTSGKLKQTLVRFSDKTIGNDAMII